MSKGKFFIAFGYLQAGEEEWEEGSYIIDLRDDQLTVEYITELIKLWRRPWSEMKIVDFHISMINRIAEVEEK